MRCRHCGTENPGQHLFCGMCGKPLDEEVASQMATGKPGEHGAVQRPRDEPPVPAPAYTGGIFNLGAPAEKAERNLDYLLEDDEPRSHKGLVVGIVALALVAGLGYLRWRGELPWLKAGSSEAKSAAQATDTQAGGDQTAAPSSAASPDPVQNSNGAPQAVTAPPASPATSSPAPTATADTTTPPPTPSQNGSADSNAPIDSPHADAKPARSPAEAPAPATGQAPAPASVTDQASAAPAATTTATTPGPVTATPEAVPPKPKPKAKPLPPTRPEDSVAMGERYLYGRGVPQDCTRGLRHVKPAADQSNPKAMITMGALYATGHCLSKDLPTAYRFFALALRKDPGNGALKQNAEMVWGQMTASERQQAIRMTQ